MARASETWHACSRRRVHPSRACCSIQSLLSQQRRMLTLRAKLFVSLPMLQMVAISACKPSWSTRCGQHMISPLMRSTLTCCNPQST